MAKSRRKPGPSSQKLAKAAKKAAPVAALSVPGSLATAGALLSAGVALVGAALIGGGATLAASIIAGAFKFFLTANASRWQVWYAEYARGDAADPDLVEAQLQAEAEDPIVHELVVENARAIAEALTPSVLPALARLTREYKSTRKGPDAFFRGMRRLLSDLSEEEFRSLQALMNHIAAIVPEHETQRWVAVERSEQQAQFHRVSSRGQGSTIRTRMLKVLPWATPFPRVMHLLRANGFTADETTFGASSGPFDFEVDLARRVSALLS